MYVLTKKKEIHKDNNDRKKGISMVKRKIEYHKSSEQDHGININQ